MNRILALIILLCTGCTTVSQAQENAAGSHSLLWKISSKEMRTPSYLFGTIHIICAEDYIWTNAMKKSLEATEEVCLEMDMDNPSLTMDVIQGLRDNSGKTLEDHFGKENYAKLKRYLLDSMGVNIDAFAQMKPMVLPLLFSTSEFDCDSTVSYESNLVSAASLQNKEVTGLETVKEQIDLLDRIPTDSIVSELMNVVNGTDNCTEEYSEMINAYKKQDIVKLHELILKSKEMGDDLNMFLDERNEKWIERMTERMDQHAVFFAVGAGHLWGENGLINLLRNAGYTVEPIK